MLKPRRAAPRLRPGPQPPHGQQQPPHDLRADRRLGARVERLQPATVLQQAAHRQATALPRAAQLPTMVLRQVTQGAAEPPRRMGAEPVPPRAVLEEQGPLLPAQAGRRQAAKTGQAARIGQAVRGIVPGRGGSLHVVQQAAESGAGRHPGERLCPGRRMEARCRGGLTAGSATCMTPGAAWTFIMA